MQVLHLSVGENPVELVLDLVLGPEPGSEGQALLLPGQLQQVRALPHDGGAAGRHLEHLLFGRIPRDHVELLHLSLAEEAAGAAAEDRRWGVWVELRWGEASGGLDLLGGGGGGFVGHRADGAVGGRGGLGGFEGGEVVDGLLPWGRDAVGGFGGGDGGVEEGGLGCHGHGSVCLGGGDRME